jgi:hypothetical protein
MAELGLEQDPGQKKLSAKATEKSQGIVHEILYDCEEEHINSTQLFF